MSDPKPVGSKFFSIAGIRNFFNKWQWSRDSSFGSYFKNYYFNSDTPVLIDTDDALTAFSDCHTLQTVINRKADMFANGEWKCVDVNDETKEFPDDEGLKLLNRPNAMQTAEEWLKAYIFYKSLYANNFIYALRGSQFVMPAAIWHLPSEWMKVEFSGKFFDQTKIEEIIKKFILCYGGTEKVYEVKDVIYKAENFSFSERKGMSKIPSLRLPISNIVAALKTRNIISVEKGMIGILSNESKDAVGALGLKTGEKEMIESSMAEGRGLYGDRSKIVVTESNLKWNAMSYPTKELALFEETEEDFASILGAFGMKRELFPTVTGSTFENQNQAEKSTYQSTIQPEADSLAAAMTTALGADKRRRKYILDYSWLPILQEDKLKEENADLIKQRKLSSLFADGMIDAINYCKMMGIDFTGTGIRLSSSGGGTTDVLGKIPLALQQLALTRERAVAANDQALIKQIGDLQDTLVAQLAEQAQK